MRKFYQLQAHGAPGTEVDYWDQLSPEMVEWLKKFNRQTTLDYKKKGERRPLTRAKTRENRVAKNKRRHDATYQKQVPFPEPLEYSTNPEDPLIRGIDAFSTRGLAYHLRKNTIIK